ncbi:MAG TPA: pyruvate:ferredoxin (flavodoxin) oxidoreductase [Candidatus Sulfotelmatobacter sp.]|nr:pyruvate:ferredoxin (flavodoxin) oxidoreductase [Candidatus Sulfotelmatobacter sp.]
MYAPPSRPTDVPRPITDQRWECLDGNEAAARVAYALSEVISIYPITPASPMAEHADDWAAAGRPNLWGKVPDVVEMQSEGGAAGAMHGALQKGAFATTFTASQGLLLMIPNMFKIAGELTPAVIHVAARTIATHALSIFGDHSDVMHARSTGWAMLAAGSVQEAHDFALVAHAATLRSRVPFLHFFDGFRTSHEINKIALLAEDDMRALVRDEDLLAFRARGLTPEAPVLRGTAQNPDVFFQAREACNPYHLAVPGIVQQVMDELGERTGRRYGLVDYHGAPDADRVVVVMGSAAGAVEETVDALVAAGERVGLVRVRLFQPFPAPQLLAALPPTVRAIAVLDRTKEPGAVGEPLYLEVVAALAEGMDSDTPPFRVLPRIIGGRYGLSSKEMTPGMIKPIFEELSAVRPRRHFTVGIHDDVTHLSLPIDAGFEVVRPKGEVQAVFLGLGSDGTVGANKSSVKIIGEGTDLFVQGYFEYDSKKSGTVTVSHLRFGPQPIRSTYLVSGADFVACHQFGLLTHLDVLDKARPGATFLLNSPYGADEVWAQLPGRVRRALVDKHIDFWIIDAAAVANEVGMGARINTVMQPCFFQLAGVLPPDEAIARIKDAVRQTYGRRGEALVARNFAAIDRSLERLVHVPLGAPGEAVELPGPADDDPREFVRRVTAALIAGRGDLLPVSAMPVDGTFPTGTTKYEKRAIAQQIPVWDPTICIDCGKCAIVCPHGTIRMKVFPTAALAGAPADFKHKEFRSHDLPDHRLTIQVAPDDCTGCGVCVEVCPAKSKTELRHKSIDMEPVEAHRDLERPRWEFFQSIPPLDRSLLAHDTVKGSQVLEPLFEFSGACGGCGETPYLKLVSQLFGDRMIVANATGCSSIYGANLPTTPWTVNAQGRGPAWSNSLFEDNAEFGLGMRLALDAQADHARLLLTRLAPAVGPDLVHELLESSQDSEVEIAAQRDRVARLRERLAAVDGAARSDAQHLQALAHDLVAQGIWIIGGDGWAYDIGFGGLDQVLSSGRNVNILVLDTEVYSNTGGQASKATPRAAVAKFAAAGKATGKKDLGAIARAYGNVFVAQVAMGGSDAQTTKALLEAAAWPGPSLVIAYSTCIAHGIDMSQSMAHQKDAVRSGYWPLYRFHPSEIADGQPFKLDSQAPSLPMAEFMAGETRFAVLQRTHPERAAELAQLAQADTDERWRYYEQLAGMHRSVPHVDRHAPLLGGDGADPATQPDDREALA